MTYVHTTLAYKTRMFWLLSSSFEGRIEEDFTFLEASGTIKSLQQSLGPHHPLTKRLHRLNGEIINAPDLPYQEATNPCDEITLPQTSA